MNNIMKRPTPTQKAEEHRCIGHKEGDWIIFICPVCKQYQRSINCVTRQVVVIQGNSGAIHVGTHSPFVTDPKAFGNN